MSVGDCESVLFPSGGTSARLCWLPNLPHPLCFRFQHAAARLPGRNILIEVAGSRQFLWWCGTVGLVALSGLDPPTPQFVGAGRVVAASSFHFRCDKLSDLCDRRETTIAGSCPGHGPHWLVRDIRLDRARRDGEMRVIFVFWDAPFAG